MPADRTPDPAVQVVERIIRFGVHGSKAEDAASEIVSALREAGHIKNLRQVGWRSAGGHLHDEKGVGFCYVHDTCTPVCVEEGDQ